MEMETWTRTSSIKRMSNWVRFDHDCLRPDDCPECDRNQEKTRKILLGGGGNVTINPSSDSGMLTWENKSSAGFKIVINVPNMFDFSSLDNNKIHVEIICGNKHNPSEYSKNHKDLISSGWFWPKIDSEASNGILCSTKPGTFMVRESSDPSHMFTLSVQTERGPTSVRLNHGDGKFWLDSDKKLAFVLPKFKTVIALVEHYVNGGANLGKQVWIGPNGQTHSRVRVTKPYRKEVGSLQHLSRLAINKNGLPVEGLPLKIQNYLSEYTYTL